MLLLVQGDELSEEKPRVAEGECVEDQTECEAHILFRVLLMMNQRIDVRMILIAESRLTTEIATDGSYYS